jgi:4-amino-4-deoxy-L-arabinose transferase-like glycosyltransferase
MKIRLRAIALPLAILGLAAIFRLARLDEVPPGLYCDEASTGYDAYSLLKTGRDQYGVRLPLFARSFGDYNEATYRYLTIPFVALLGPTEIAVRLPAALVGILTVGLVWLLGRELLDRRTALAAALLLAISPWHVQFSRVGFRGILFPFGVCFGMLLFFRGLRSPRALVAAGAVFAGALHTYSPARLFVPLLVGILAVLYRREVRAAGRPALLAAGVFGLGLAVLAPHWLSEEGMARAEYELRFGPGEIARNYVSYFDPRFLFLDGDPLIRQNPRGVALLHLFEIATVAAGLVALARRRDRTSLLLGLWILLYPFPGAITAWAHSIRGLTGAPLFALISALGIVRFLDLFSGRGRAVTAGVAGAVVLASAVHYARVYFIRYPLDSYRDWQYGMRQAIHYAEGAAHDRVFLSDLFFLPHIFVLFYTSHPPRDYQADPLTGLEQGTWTYTGVTIGRYRITDVQRMPSRGNHLLVLPPRQSEYMTRRHGCRVVESVRGPDGAPVVNLVETPP